MPISRLTDCLVETEKDLKTSTLPIVIAGHVGDGNFHLGILFSVMRDIKRALDPDNLMNPGKVLQI